MGGVNQSVESRLDGMDIFVHHLPNQATQKQVKKFFDKELKKFDIHRSSCFKIKNKDFASITVADANKALQFLRQHGQDQKGRSWHIQLRFRGKDLFCRRSDRTPDPHIVAGLKQEEIDRLKVLKRRRPASGNVIQSRCFDSDRLMVGRWTYKDTELIFASHHTDKRRGRLIFGSYAVALKLERGASGGSDQMLEFPNDTILDIVTWTDPPSLTLSLIEAPKIYDQPFEARPPSKEEWERMSDYEKLVEAMILEPTGKKEPRQRLGALDDAHRKIVGSCFCYRISLRTVAAVQAIAAWKRKSGLPDSVSFNIGTHEDTLFAPQMSELQHKLAHHNLAHVSYEVKFQLQRLAQNGYLSPSTVLELLPEVIQRLDHTRDTAVASAIRHLADTVPFPSPVTDAQDFTVLSLLEAYKRSERSILEDDPYMDRLVDEYDHIMRVHRALVTPTGIFLSGPENEVNNRVLRKYSRFTNYFLSVTFADENGERLRLGPNTEAREIYHEVFKGVLNTHINIAGRPFEVSAPYGLCIIQD